MAHETHGLDEAFEAIEAAILPSLSTMLDTLLEASALARPGLDAAAYATELKSIGCALEALRGQLEQAAASAGYPDAEAPACETRMSA